MSAAEQEEFLDTDGVLLRIATVRETGAPHVTPTWFLRDGHRLVFTPRSEAVWFANLRREPRVALCIDEDPLPYRKVTVEGTAEVLHEPGVDDVWRDTYRRIAGKYLQHDDAAVERYIERTLDQPRGLVGVDLRTATVRSWRMPVDDEPDTGMWHARYYAAGSALAQDTVAR